MSKLLDSYSSLSVFYCWVYEALQKLTMLKTLGGPLEFEGDRFNTVTQVVLGGPLTATQDVWGITYSNIYGPGGPLVGGLLVAWQDQETRNQAGIMLQFMGWGWGGVDWWDFCVIKINGIVTNLVRAGIIKIQANSNHITRCPPPARCTAHNFSGGSRTSVR